MRETLNYVAQAHELGIITDAQRNELESAIRDAWRDWQPKLDHGVLFPDDVR